MDVSGTLILTEFFKATLGYHIRPWPVFNMDVSEILTLSENCGSSSEQFIVRKYNYLNDW